MVSLLCLIGGRTVCFSSSEIRTLDVLRDISWVASRFQLLLSGERRIGRLRRGGGVVCDVMQYCAMRVEDRNRMTDVGC